MPQKTAALCVPVVLTQFVRGGEDVISTQEHASAGQGTVGRRVMLNAQEGLPDPATFTVTVCRPAPPALVTKIKQRGFGRERRAQRALQIGGDPVAESSATLSMGPNARVTENAQWPSHAAAIDLRRSDFGRGSTVQSASTGTTAPPVQASVLERPATRAPFMVFAARA